MHSAQTADGFSAPLTAGGGAQQPIARGAGHLAALGAPDEADQRDPQGRHPAEAELPGAAVGPGAVRPRPGLPGPAGGGEGAGGDDDHRRRQPFGGLPLAGLVGAGQCLLCGVCVWMGGGGGGGG